MNPEWEFLTKTLYDPAIFWSMATAVCTFLLVLATAALVWVGFVQLRQLVKTSKADFVDRLKRDFFTVEARRLIFLVEHDFLDFHQPAGEIPYFTIRPVAAVPMRNRMRELEVEGGSISTFTFDDVLLGPLEDVATFEAIGNVELETVYSFFSAYIDDVMTNTALLSYIHWARQDSNAPDLYVNLERLHQKLAAYDSVTTAKSRG